MIIKVNDYLVNRDLFTYSMLAKKLSKGYCSHMN